MTRKRSKKPIPVPHFTVRSERDLNALRFWFRRLPDFTDADAGEGKIAVTRKGKPVAEIVCQDKTLRYNAECIGTYVSIMRQWGYEVVK